MVLIGLVFLLGLACAQTGSLVAGSGAEEATTFQSVGGDFGAAWLKEFLTYNEPPVQADRQNDLWSWGGAPQGKKIEDGRLVDDIFVNTTNITGEWLGEATLGTPVLFNGSVYNNLADGTIPLSDFYLSSDPWIRAQQLGTTVRTPFGLFDIEPAGSQGPQALALFSPDIS
ncbi:MAG: hypothetical protein GKC10_04590 [Methanosarcinales archaeon]|nr:hypothetical protein [Methanosarcinales archaeon]